MNYKEYERLEKKLIDIFNKLDFYETDIPHQRTLTEKVFVLVYHRGDGICIMNIENNDTASITEELVIKINTSKSLEDVKNIIHECRI